MRQSINFSALARRLIEQGHTTKSLGAAVGLSQPAASRLAAGKTGDVTATVGLRLIELAGGAVHLPPELLGVVPPELPAEAAVAVQG